MSKQVDAYFKNENDAEAVHARLQTLKVNNVSVEEIPEGTDTKVLVPFFPANTGTGTNGGFAPIAPLVNNKQRNQSGDGNPETLSHMLHFEVDEADYQKAMDILKESDCYGRQSQVDGS
ncbi:hypothetical protein ERJ70_15075 [Sediminibacillus dalangtanensis]|uniref:Heat induced stress protein YflT n=1 Tax=Sediminibacillus dalangtanensis TaxID=2729421 RepID=A0ABX7VXX6_9BACI|nr:hypothetical protein [Sediminibacillus dalangtanensis]QTN00506.1 hypothetical protein ERJ70_15075 [Sediminibacillus dalangtanensis]